MPNPIQVLRSTSAGARPTGQLPGAPFVNYSDMQFGVVDISTAALDLLAVRFYSTTAHYNVGDFVVQAGNVYRCITANGPGAFNAANWSRLVTVADGTGLFLPLAGGTMTGPIVLAADPSAPLQPATKQYADLKVAGTINRVVSRVFTTLGAQTYTPTTGMVYAQIECVGGGGGGGGTANSAAGTESGGGGGGGGGYSRKLVTAADIGASQTVTIGAGGAATASGDNDGNDGADTSVGALCIAKGGLHGGKGTTRGGGGGGPQGTGDITIAGMQGQGGLSASIMTVSASSGQGGHSGLAFGAGAAERHTHANGGNGGYYGGGGGGGLSLGAGGTTLGGAGAQGVVIITEYCH